jgi:hypothetical protein
MRHPNTSLSKIITATCLSVGVFFAPQVFAARPLNTDDANVVDPQSCQDESWVKKSKTSIERWIVPGCNFFGDTEISFGANFQSDTGATSSQYHLMQAKKRWRVLEPGDWGISSTLGTLKRSGTTPTDTVNDVYLNVPITWSLGQERFAHLNIGWVKHQAQGYGAKTWGLAFEQAFNSHVVGILETYGEEKQSTKYQVGLRFWVIPQRVQLDTTLGNVWGSTSNPAQRWVSVGLRLLSPPLF